jgi:hypothetical protein
MSGGISTVFQDFTNRITIFFFKLKVSAIHIKTLFMRIYATLFSIMYMGTSGINSIVNFTSTPLFQFLNTFCFPGNTELLVKKDNTLHKIPIRDVKIGDVLYPGAAQVTATFKFYSRGQQMVQLGSTIVSTNHYVYHRGKPIKAGQHPSAINVGSWDSDELLYCLNTTTNKIPVQYLTFLDYDETSVADKDTMYYIDKRLNGRETTATYNFTEYGFGIEENTSIKMENGRSTSAKDIKIGDILSNKSKVVGVISREFHEICKLANGLIVTPSTLYWDETQWRRFGEVYRHTNGLMKMISFVVTPNSQIELENGLIVRDYMELCSPDAELYYSQCLELGKN